MSHHVPTLPSVLPSSNTTLHRTSAERDKRLNFKSNVVFAAAASVHGAEADWAAATAAKVNGSTLLSADSDVMYDAMARGLRGGFWVQRDLCTVKAFSVDKVIKEFGRFFHEDLADSATREEVISMCAAVASYDQTLYSHQQGQVLHGLGPAAVGGIVLELQARGLPITNEEVGASVVGVQQNLLREKFTGMNTPSCDL